MKDCCKNNKDNHRKPYLKKWFNYIVYMIIATIVIWTLILQINGQK
jgi:hypothetical protein